MEPKKVRNRISNLGFQNILFFKLGNIKAWNLYVEKKNRQYYFIMSGLLHFWSLGFLVDFKWSVVKFIYFHKKIGFCISLMRKRAFNFFNWSLYLFKSRLLMNWNAISKNIEHHCEAKQISNSNVWISSTRVLHIFFRSDREIFSQIS